MALEPAILSHTKTNVPLAANRVGWLTMGQGTAKPYVVLRVVSKNFVHAMGGNVSGLTQTRVQFSVFSDDYADVKGVVEEIKKAYRKYIEGDSTKKMGSAEWVQATLLENEIDFYEPDTGLHHTALDVIFWHVEVDAVI